MYITTDARYDRADRLDGLEDAVKLGHFQQLVTEDPKKPGVVLAGKIELLDPNLMNPGFISAGSGNVVLDVKEKGLQPCLEKLLINQYPFFLKADKPGQPSACDRVRIALVNMSGARWFKPELAMWGGASPMEGASVPKLLAVYALHQLRFDLRVLAVLKKAMNPKDLIKAAKNFWKDALPITEQPDFVELFDWKGWSGVPESLQFSDRTNDRLRAAISCNDNCAMGRLIVQLGFPFIGSVALQSGLFEPINRGGLWLSASYAGKAVAHKDCPRPESCEGVNRHWRKNPIKFPKPLFGHNTTALSVASFYTLLGQCRLISPQSSRDMQWVLAGGCNSGPFGDLLNKNIRTRVLSSKCGILPKFRKRLKIYGCKDAKESTVINDSALFVDTSVDPALCYVLVIMAYVPRAILDGKPVPANNILHGLDYGKLVRDLESLLRFKAQYGDACL